MSWLSFLKRKKKVLNDLEFVDQSKTIFSTIPIEMAKNVDVYVKEKCELEKRKFKFPLCPGIWDYSRMGYILNSWTDFHIKANKAGSVVIMGGNGRSAPFTSPFAMDFDLTDGMFEYEGTPKNAWNFPSPWKIYTHNKNISAIVLPATFHSKPEIFENLFVVPGVVDYDKFHAVNFICAVRKACEFTISAGDPLLHIIPFMNAEISCGYGPPNVEQDAENTYDPIVHTTHFYRKEQTIKKQYGLSSKTGKEVDDK